MVAGPQGTGTKAVATAAHEAGIPKVVRISGQEKQTLVGEGGNPPTAGIAIGADSAQVRPFDMASAFATFAARGVYRAPFFVAKITGPTGDVLYQHVDQPVPAFDPVETKSRDIADNVTETLKVIPASSGIGCAGGRECAGKTGTHELPGSLDQNSKAWMVGYTPQLSTSVWVGKDQGNVAIKNKEGKAIFGSGLPGLMWKKFMDAALTGVQAEKFPKPNPLGNFEPRKSDPPSSSQTTTNPVTTTNPPNGTTTTGKPPVTTTTTQGCPPATTCGGPTTTTTTTKALPGGEGPGER
jgi:membrane peptidoglycan carboxypeptidase